MRKLFLIMAVVSTVMFTSCSTKTVVDEVEVLEVDTLEVEVLEVDTLEVQQGE